MIINIRGTGGSGKTTLARRIMEMYPRREEKRDEVEGRARVVAVQCTGDGLHPLYVLGKYTTATGGCDTLPNLDVVYDLVRQAAGHPAHVLFEGIMASEEVTRAVECHKRNPGQFLVVQLTTPLEVCLASIRERREARGEEKPLNPKNTTERHKRVGRACDRLRAAGVRLERLDREAALHLVCREFSLGAP